MGICDRFKKLLKNQNKSKSEELNDEIIQKQIAGENSKQIQMGTVVINQGITEERVRAVFSEMIPQALEECYQEAYKIADNRIKEFENYVVPKILDSENAVSALSDPAFQMLLRKAQKVAAATDRVDDYSILSELIMYHIQKESRKNRLGVVKAIEIVDVIDNDALCGLTSAYAILNYYPVAGSIDERFQVYEKLFEKLIYMDLPKGKDWLDHLDILGAIRIKSVGRLKSFKEYFSEAFNGYICIGIPIDTDEYKTVLSKLAGKIDQRILVNNELLDGYVRLNITNKGEINKLQVIEKGIKRPINATEIAMLEEIMNLYSTDKRLMQIVQDNYIRVWDSYTALKQLRIWWESIPISFEITKVGAVLAHTNAKRIDSELPDFLE